MPECSGVVLSPFLSHFLCGNETIQRHQYHFPLLLIDVKDDCMAKRFYQQIIDFWTMPAIFNLHIHRAQNALQFARPYQWELCILNSCTDRRQLRNPFLIVHCYSSCG